MKTLNNIKPYLILSATSLVMLILCTNNLHQVEVTPSKQLVEVLPVDTVLPIDLLIEALIKVESGGKADAVGDSHLDSPSIGVLQIRPIMVREVNRILKKRKVDTRFKLKDRFSRLKSIKMFNVWKNHHHRNDNFETIARSWNGGPRGPSFKSTKVYWGKVKSKLEL
jgi:hypothetical protein